VAFNDPQLVHVDRVLTNISVGYSDPNFVGDILFPEVSVDQQSNKYNVFDKNAARSVYDDIRGPKAMTNEILPWTLSRDTNFAVEHALKGWVAVEEVGNQDPTIDSLAMEVRRVTGTILLNRENQIQTKARTTGNYASGLSTTLSGTSQWSDYTNSNPISDLKAARDAVFLSVFNTPNVAILGYEVATKLEDHPAFLNRMKTTPLADNQSLSAVGTLVGIPRLIRANAVYNSAVLGQAASFGYLWGKDVIVANVGTPDAMNPVYGAEFVWRFGADTNPSDRWFDTDRKSWAVRTSRRYDTKFIAVDTVASGKAAAGYLIKTAVA